MQATVQVRNTVKLFALGAVWGGSFLCIEIALRGFTPLSIAALRIAPGAAALLVVAHLRGDAWPPWSQPPATYPTQVAVWAALLFLGLAGTGFAYLLRFQLIQDAGVTFLAQVAYLVPRFAILWGWWFLAEIPGGRTWIALALILTGVFVGQSKRFPVPWQRIAHKRMQITRANAMKGD